MLEYFLKPKEDRIFTHCDYCGGEIYEGEDYYNIDDKRIHDDCIYDYCRELYSSNRRIAE